MNNSTAVFGNYNQFSKSTEVLATKPHYYPSNKKELDENSKKIGLTQKYVDLPAQLHDDSTFFGEGKGMTGHTPEYSSYIDSSASSKYNESWPITDDNISLQNNEISPKDMNGSNKEHSIEDYLEKNGENKENKGTLFKYVQRFREQPPRSRVERVSQKGGKNAEFWWLASPTHPISSTPYSSDSSTPLQPNSLSFSPSLSDQDSIIFSAEDKQRMPQPRLLYGSDSDSGVARMQLRTEKLLQLSENAVKDSSLSTSLKSQNPYPQRCKDILSPTEEKRKFTISSNGSEENSVYLPKVSEPRKPEDDILYKWRLMRKMELAAKSTSSNAFLKIIDAKKDTNSAKIICDESSCEVDKIEDKLLKVTAKENNTDEILINTINMEKESAQSKAALDTNNVLDGDIRLDTCCKKTCQNCVQHSNCEDSHLHCASIKRGRHEKIHCGRESCGCCEMSNLDEVSCSGHRLPKNAKCNPYVYHIPSLVHIYDVMPCHHKRQANIPCHQCDSALMEKKDKLSSGEFKENLELQVGEKSPCKNTVSPIINQVISDHLFIDSEESIEIASKPMENTKEKSSFKAQSENDSSSGDEYPDDEILRELRCRRRNNKNEWRMICEQLRLKRMRDIDSKS